jgi:hypothetical protein
METIMIHTPTVFSLIWSIMLVILAGCSSNSASVAMPTIDPKEAGNAAVAAYDINQDGMIDAAESDKTPPLKAILRGIDSDGDSKISGDEIAARIDQWHERNIVINTFVCKVLYNGAPLSGAVVTFVPEEFLGPNIPSARGVTSPQGYATLTVASDELPVSNLSGVYCGLYRVEISRIRNRQETIPSKYNSATVLGQEIPELRRELATAEVIYDLRSGGGR